MSWALLEAMAAHLPCIATDVGANDWMLGQGNGWIVLQAILLNSPNDAHGHGDPF